MKSLTALLQEIENVRVIDDQIPYNQYVPIDLSTTNEDFIKLKIETSSDFEFYIEKYLNKNNAKVAFDVFKKLGMDQTKERNAVLFHVNFEKKYLTIIGDKGIHEKVHQKFWNDLHDKITQAFSEGKYYQGLHDAILETGMELKNFFPIKDGENPNELSNEITFS